MTFNRRPVLMDAEGLPTSHREPALEGLEAAHSRLERRVSKQAAVLAVEQAIFDSLKGELASLDIQIGAVEKRSKGKGKERIL